MKRKIKITGIPKLQKGGSSPVVDNTDQFPWPEKSGGAAAEGSARIAGALSPVPRPAANLEAERGEVAMVPSEGGIPVTLKVGGTRHSKGGTPLKLPENAFIFSDTKKMMIKDPIILAQFGMAMKKGGYTPAKIATKFLTDKYFKMLKDGGSDEKQISTAEMMISNNNLKLAQLALIQESMKGFPTGIPKIAMPYMERFNIDPAMFFDTENLEQQGMPQYTKSGGQIVSNVIKKYLGGGEEENPVWRPPFIENQFHGPYTPDVLDQMNQPAQDPTSPVGPAGPMDVDITGKKKWDYEGIPMAETMLAGLDTATNLFNMDERAQLEKDMLAASTAGATHAYGKVGDRGSYLQNSGVFKPTKKTAVQFAGSAVANALRGRQEGGDVKKMIRITGMPELAKGGDEKFDPYNPEFTKALIEKLGKDVSYDAILPAYLLNDDGTINEEMFNKSVAEYQGLRYKPGKTEKYKNIYGRRDWSEKEYMDDFKKRHKWYFDKNPDFDPENTEDVKDFQTKYNERAEEYGLPKYFAEDGKFKVDTLFGENTYATPSLNDLKKAKEATEKGDPVPEKAKEAAVAAAQGPNAPWWAQDIVNTMGAVGDFARIKKYPPWIRKPNVHLPDVTFYDPERELASSAEMVNQGIRGMSAFAGPQAYGSIASRLAGVGFKNAADIMGRYNNLNVGVANAHEQNVANLLNQHEQLLAKADTELYDKYNIMEQQFDNAKNQARANIRQGIIQGITNAANAQAMNTIFENFGVDPLRGGTVGMTRARPLTADQQTDPIEQRAKAVGNILEQYPWLAENPALAKSILGDYTGQPDNLWDREAAALAAGVGSYNPWAFGE